MDLDQIRALNCHIVGISYFSKIHTHDINISMKRSEDGRRIFVVRTKCKFVDEKKVRRGARCTQG